VIAKPEACRGCPLYGDGQGFVADEILPSAPVFILGQNPRQAEEREGRPFVGTTGDTMLRVYFPLADLHRGENVHIGNTLRCRLSGHCTQRGQPMKCNHMPTGKVLAAAVTHCTTQHLHIPDDVRLVIAQGAHAWRLLSPRSGSITDWRGFLAVDRERSA